LISPFSPQASSDGSAAQAFSQKQSKEEGLGNNGGGKGVRTWHRWTTEEELILREVIQMQASSTLKWSIIQEDILSRTGTDFTIKQVSVNHGLHHWLS
jgi:hypothetical protein